MGNVDAASNYPTNQYHFCQDSHFLYFFGLQNQGFAGVIDLDNDNDYIFGNDFDIDDIIWMGVQPQVKDLAAKANIETTAPYAKLAKLPADANMNDRTIHYLPPYRSETVIELSQLLGSANADVKHRASVELIKIVVKLKEIKSEEEIAETICIKTHHPKAFS